MVTSGMYQICNKNLTSLKHTNTFRLKFVNKNYPFFRAMNEVLNYVYCLPQHDKMMYSCLLE